MKELSVKSILTMICVKYLDILRLVYTLLLLLLQGINKQNKIKGR